MKKHIRVTRREFIVGGAACVCLCAAGMPGTARAAEEADTLFINGIVYTVDEADSIAEALAVKEGRIIFVGSAKEAEAFKGPKTEVVDLQGGMLLPGFVDTHIHTPGSLLPHLFDFSLLGIYSAEATLEAITQVVKHYPDKKAYYGFGYPTNAFSGEEAGKGPKKERLDAICADKPIIIFSNDGHSLWLNSKAFEVSGITKDTQPREGGIIEKDEKTGELWGVVKETAMAQTTPIVFTRENLLHTLQDFQTLMNSLGYTGIQSIAAFVPAFGPVPWEALAELDKDNSLTLKVHGSHCIVATDNVDEEIAKAKKLREQYNNEFLSMNMIKFFADGVVDTRTAFLKEPYLDNPENRGNPGWVPDALNAAYAKVNSAGFQIHTHSIGDAATSMVLDGYEYARANSPKGDYRNTITHLQLVDPKDIPRFKELSVIASVQPYWHMKQPDFYEPVEKAALGERAEAEYPMKSFFDAGVTVTSSSDSPVTDDPNPMFAIQVAVTRNLLGGKEYGVPDITDPDDATYLLGAKERPSVAQMIRSFTASSAYTVFAEKETGSLEAGKWADLAVLDKNILECPVLEIHKAKVKRTYVNGSLVYNADEPASMNMPHHVSYKSPKH